jgi:hypothetical protein
LGLGLGLGFGLGLGAHDVTRIAHARLKLSEERELVVVGW